MFGLQSIPFDKGGRFIVEIRDIDVSPSAVLPLAMILNELCTNAVKYGAVSNTSGSVAVSATINASKERFGFRWAEKDGPDVQMPTGQSFGTRLIEQGFVGEPRGKAHLAFEPTGVVCNLDIPLASHSCPHANWPSRSNRRSFYPDPCTSHTWAARCGSTRFLN